MAAPYFCFVCGGEFLEELPQAGGGSGDAGADAARAAGAAGGEGGVAGGPYDDPREFMRRPQQNRAADSFGFGFGPARDAADTGPAFVHPFQLFAGDPMRDFGRYGGAAAAGVPGGRAAADGGPHNDARGAPQQPLDGAAGLEQVFADLRGMLAQARTRLREAERESERGRAGRGERAAAANAMPEEGRTGASVDADAHGSLPGSRGARGAQQQSAQAGRGRRPAGDPRLDPLLQMMGQLFGIHVHVEGVDAAPMAGNLGDYYTGSLDRLAEQLAEQFPASAAGPPPASKDAVAALKSVTVDAARVAAGEMCYVCQEAYTEGEVDVLEMPCGHLFHSACLKPWLEIHNNCPVCRHELPTDDADYERQRAARSTGGRRQGDASSDAAAGAAAASATPGSAAEQRGAERAVAEAAGRVADTVADSVADAIADSFDGAFAGGDSPTPVDRTAERAIFDASDAIAAAADAVADAVDALDSDADAVA
eukprot:PRCOL_00003418-RA